MTEYTWGVYLRPDPITCMAIADITELCKRQFGIVSAAAFAPHATLAGAVPSDASAKDFIQILDPVLGNESAFAVYNAGIARRPDSVYYDIDRNEDGSVNGPLHRLATVVNETIAPLTAYQPGEWSQPFVPEKFWAHFSLASHDLRDRADLRDEVEAFIRALPIAYSQTFTAEYVTLFRFHSANWFGDWWQGLSWEHVKSWRLTQRIA